MIWSRDTNLSGRLVYMVNYASSEPWLINISVFLDESFITCHSGTCLKILKRIKKTVNGEEIEEQPWNWTGYLDFDLEDKVCL